MPLFFIILTVAIMAVILSIRAENKDSSEWLKSRRMDFIVFISTFTSFVFSVGITGRIAIYVSEYNLSVAIIMGGLVMNLALFFVPGFLFVSSLILAIRLIRHPTKD